MRVSEDGTEVTPDSEELDGLEEEDDGDLLIRDEDLDDDEELDDELDGQFKLTYFLYLMNR